MKTDSPAFPDEVEHLAFILQRLEEAVGEANASVERIDREYRDAKRYMADYRGEIDPHEMFQNELALKQIDQMGAFSVGVWEKLARLRESPYFARIDFRQQGQPAAKHYIGRFAFSHGEELLVFDWRAPLAGMFYDCEAGPAGYDAPLGRIEGELTRKRQFKITNGVLEYALESAVNIQDDVLQRELSHTSDEKMKSIISTIQKEQNQIIRNESAATLIIQGVAGSGKTSIALHRVAYLLYRQRDRLSAKNVAILSPNRVFGDYISTVLPELGEEPIGELSLGDIAAEQLKGVIGFAPDSDPLETGDAGWAERARFKSTLDFVQQLECFLQQAPAVVFAPEGYSWGSFTATAEDIRARFDGYYAYPITKRLQLLAHDIHDRLAAQSFLEDDLPRPREILRSLSRMLKVKNSLALYKEFYRWLGRPRLLALPARQTLEWPDVYPFLYLHGWFEGVQESRTISHLVIDEMQDYTPVQYAVINRLYPCQKTILGDFGQCVNPNHLHTLEDLQRQYGGASLVTLTKSYRSTYEIITFAKAIQPAGLLEPVERHGEKPTLAACRDELEQLAVLQRKIADFGKSGYASMGIILKTNSAARRLYERLAPQDGIQLITPESAQFAGGVSVTSIRMAKGLEFDQVVVADADDDTYNTPYDRGLLYIAATRAMHKLTVLHTGRPSRFLPGDSTNG